MLKKGEKIIVHDPELAELDRELRKILETKE
jgi:hypothetical protein